MIMIIAGTEPHHVLRLDLVKWLIKVFRWTMFGALFYGTFRHVHTHYKLKYTLFQLSDEAYIICSYYFVFKLLTETPVLYVNDNIKFL